MNPLPTAPMPARRAAAALPVLLALCALAACPRPASALDATAFPADTARLEIYEHGEPVANESFTYTPSGDSVVVMTHHTRRLRGADGKVHVLEKYVAESFGASDIVLRTYGSTLMLEGHKTTKGIMPGDTTMSVYTERDGRGEIDRVTQPPGRYFVIEPMAYTLFDLIGRSLHRQTFTARPVELVVLGTPPGSSEMTARDNGPDPIVWGTRRVETRRYTLSDSTTAFELWISPEGRLLRLENRKAGVIVLRRLPEPAKPRAAKPAARRAAGRPAAAKP